MSSTEEIKFIILLCDISIHKKFLIMVTFYINIIINNILLYEIKSKIYKNKVSVSFLINIDYFLVIVFDSNNKIKIL